MKPQMHTNSLDTRFAHSWRRIAIPSVCSSVHPWFHFLHDRLRARRGSQPEQPPLDLARSGGRIGLGIAQRLELPEIVGRLLAARGIDIDGACHFLDPTLRALLPDPSVLTDMDIAADRLAYAVQHTEMVGVFGDYDVDGACSSALMVTLLRQLGCEVIHHVPDRMMEGYGPNGPALHSLVLRGARLIVCVDCGTAAAKSLGFIAGDADIVVLDHHKAEGPPPAIVATVNPNRLDCTSGLTSLCAAAVAFLTAVATVRTLRRQGFFNARKEPDLIALLDLVALATVCDVMPLTGVNRALVCQGLKVMARRSRPGIAALLDVALVRDRLSTATCGFALGPASMPPAAFPKPTSACACCSAKTRWKPPHWPLRSTP